MNKKTFKGDEMLKSPFINLLLVIFITNSFFTVLPMSNNQSQLLTNPTPPPPSNSADSIPNTTGAQSTSKNEAAIQLLRSRSRSFIARKGTVIGLGIVALVGVLGYFAYQKYGKKEEKPQPKG